MFYKEVQVLGDEIQRETEGFTESEIVQKLPNIAEAALNSLKNFSQEEVLQSLSNARFCEQFMPKHKFGDSRFTLYQSSLFVIELNIWQSVFTAVHEHSFSGAFKIIIGSAIEGVYQWTPDEVLADNVELGNLNTVSVDVLNTNDCRVILFGDSYIHNLVHLENPTATLIVRTCSDGGAKWEQREFLMNRLCFPSFVENKDIHCAKEYLKMLNGINDKGFTKHVVNVLEKLSNQDLLLSLFIYYKNLELENSSEINDLINTKLGGDYASRILKYVRQDAIISGQLHNLRCKKLSPKTNSFLAILMIANTKKDVLCLCDALHGLDDVERIRYEVIHAINEEAKLFSAQSERELIDALNGKNEGDDLETIKQIKAMFQESLFRSII